MSKRSAPKDPVPQGFDTPLWPQPIPVTDGRNRRIGYARVSTTDQKLDLQMDILERAGCHAIYSDHGVSGAKAERAGLDKALRELIAGDVLVVFKLDRLGRSVLHLADLLTRLDNQDIHFCSLSEGINTATSGGRLVFHVFAAVAEFHRDLIRENTIAGLEAAKARGVKLGRPRLMDTNAIIEAHRLIEQEGVALEHTARRLGLSSRTLQRSMERL